MGRDSGSGDSFRADLRARRSPSRGQQALRVPEDDRASLLQRLIACQSCGYSYYRTSTRTSKRKLYYYRCLGSDDYRYEHGRVCDNLPVRQDYLDELVWNHVTALIADPELIRGELDRRLQELRATSPIAAQKAHLERGLRRTERAIHRLVEAYQEELIRPPLSRNVSGCSVCSSKRCSWDRSES